jgi:hypothetical protein
MITTKEKRAPEQVALTSDDFSILWGLSLKGYRFLTCRHIAMLHGRPETACEERMEELCGAGLVKRLRLPVIVEKQEGEPIYTLDRIGAHVLARRYHLEARKLYPPIGERSFLFLAHSIAVVDFQVNLAVAMRGDEGVRLLFWRSERELRARRTAIRKRRPDSVPVLPDAGFGVGIDGKQFFYTLEMDRGTTSIKTERAKMQGYIALYWSEEFKTFLDVPHFRVLVVSPSPRRAFAMISALKSLDYCQKMFLFTTEDNLTPGRILNRIWRRARNGEPISMLE